MIKTIFELCRVSNLPTVWTNVMAAVVLSGEPFFLPVFLILSGSLSLFYSAGMCLNDIFDADQDARDKPFRPIPAGRITKEKALAITAMLFIGAFVLLLFIPHRNAIHAGFILTLAIILYDKYHKRHPLSVLLMACCRLMVFVISGIAVSGSLGFTVAIGGGIQFAYTLLLSIVARFENRRRRPFEAPVIPLMIAGMSLLDGFMMAVFKAPAWLIAGVAGAVLTLLGQRYVRGD